MLNHRIRGEIPRTSGTYREITQPVSQHGLRAAAGAAALGSWWLSIMSVCLFNYSIICRNVNMSRYIYIYIQAQSSASSCCVGTLERMQKEFYSSTEHCIRYNRYNQTVSFMEEIESLGPLSATIAWLRLNRAIAAFQTYGKWWGGPDMKHRCLSAL